MKILQANVHQGDVTFVGHGRQCVANSITAIMKSKAHSVDQWTKADMNTLLSDGDRLYQLITSNSKMNSDYLLLDDIPSVLEGTMGYNLIQKSKPKSGLVSQRDTEGPFYHLEGAFDRLLKDMPDTDGLLLTVGTSTPSYTGAVIMQKESQTLYYFDPHSRGDTGMCESDGKATLSSHSNVASLCLFIQHLTSSLFKSVPKVPFEMVAIKTEKISDYLETLDTNSSFDGSDNELIEANSDSTEKATKETGVRNFNITFASSESDGDFSGFEPVDDNELEERLFKLNKTDSDTVTAVSDSDNDLVFQSVDEKQHEDGISQLRSDINGISTDIDPNQIKMNETNDTKLLLSETVPNMDDSFTLLKMIDTDLIENYEETSEDLSDDSSKDPNFKSSEYNSEQSSTDEDFPLHFFNKRKYFHTSKSRDKTSKNKSVGKDSSETQNSDFIEKNTANIDEIQNNKSVQEENNIQRNNYTLHQETQNTQTGLNKNGPDQENPVIMQTSHPGENQTSAQADFEPKSNRGRKRTRNENEWKRNLAKRRRNEGKDYSARSGKQMKARVMRKACGSKCKFSCNDKINEEARERVFHQFWNIGDISLQRQFIIKFAEKKIKSRGNDNLNNRTYSIKYTLPNLLTGDTHRICKTFFLNTLSISHQMVSTAHLKQEHLPGVVNSDRRGKMPGSRANRIPEEQLAIVREHIKSFPTIESHYCRKDTSRRYLDPSLTIKKMYELYCKFCSCNITTPVLLHKYREVFNTEFNLGFHQPKKDQCDLCARYRNATDSERESLAKDYETHIKNKELSRDCKSKDKERAKFEKDLAVACFDLQQILLTPKGFESSLYYRRRLNTYNFSLYNYETNDGYCYVWNESISGRGANEMASCVFDFIEKFSSNGKKRFIFYSDNASSQNKNKFYISMLWYAMNKFSLESVEHKYLITGHTQNENDSVHSTIENVSRNKEIYSTCQWAATIRSARSGKGYFVKEMSIADFFDFKLVAENLKNFELDEEKEKVYLSDIKVMKITSDEPNKVCFKTEYDQSSFKKMNLMCRLNLKSSGNVLNAADIKLMNIRTGLIPISHQKFEDLVTLCASGIIPRPHHVCYLLLPHE